VAFFGSQSAPPILKANPGTDTAAQVTLSREGRSWTEQVDLVALAASTLTRHEYAVKPKNGWLHHSESGFAITPRIVSVEPLTDGGVRTVSTIQVNHSTLAPDGVFEYQHATGDGLGQAIASGFSQWAELDFVALLEALQPKATSCATMEMEFPERDGRPARKRRAVLGPPARMGQQPATPTGDGDDGHCFCPCCFLTKSFETFLPLLEGDQLYCLRMFAFRDGSGTTGADCRVNGVDFEVGAQALRKYANSWAPAGIEYRKQLVILQSIQ
jgi:hypothetical protein